MLIAVDHGNKQIKTTHHIFTSGLCTSDTKPPFGKDILQYNGKYYTLSEQRIPYMRDKSSDDRFFILTLFAIAYELRQAKQTNMISDVQLCIGLPPAHYGALYEKFESYFLNRGIIHFQMDGNAFTIFINEAICFPQAYAAAIPFYQQIQSSPKVMVIDIGGFTADYLQIKNGQADLSVCDSLENGVIVLYNRIKSKINADFDVLLDECDIDSILLKHSSDYDENIIMTVQKQAQLFIDDLIGKLRERMIDLRTGKTVFVGGGAILLKQQLKNTSKIGTALFVDDVSANVKGYELLYKAAHMEG